MALDGAYLHAVRQELLPLLDSRIEKIHQPTREELLVAFRGRTGGGKGAVFLCGRPCKGAPYTGGCGKPQGSAYVLHAPAETAGQR